MPKKILARIFNIVMRIAIVILRFRTAQIRGKIKRLKEKKNA